MVKTLYTFGHWLLSWVKGISVDFWEKHELLYWPGQFNKEQRPRWCVSITIAGSDPPPPLSPAQNPSVVLTGNYKLQIEIEQLQLVTPLQVFLVIWSLHSIWSLNTSKLIFSSEKTTFKASPPSPAIFMIIFPRLVGWLWSIINHVMMTSPGKRVSGQQEELLLLLSPDQ